jgi:hypothetical protein
MHNNCTTSKLLALLLGLMLSGCAANSPPSPPVLSRQVKLTPLPASVREIDFRSSEPYLLKALNWKLKVEALSSGETPK